MLQRLRVFMQSAHHGQFRPVGTQFADSALFTQAPRLYAALHI